jgi:hypothetical protein
MTLNRPLNVTLFLFLVLSIVRRLASTCAHFFSNLDCACWTSWRRLLLYVTTATAPGLELMHTLFAMNEQTLAGVESTNVAQI